MRRCKKAGLNGRLIVDPWTKIENATTPYVMLKIIGFASESGSDTPAPERGPRGGRPKSGDA